MSTRMQLDRLNMVTAQLVQRGIRDKAVLRAMATVPRHLFVDPKYVDQAYDDTPLPILAGQTISQPYMVAYMTHLLELRATDSVLEVGAGSGYAAAVLSRIAAAVYTVERHEALVTQATRVLAALPYDNVMVRHGDGNLGWPEQAPFNAIVVAAGGPEVPARLLDQLAPTGRLVMPVGSSPGIQQLWRVRKVSPQEYRHEKFGTVRFVPLIGTDGWPKQAAPPAESE